MLPLLRGSPALKALEALIAVHGAVHAAN